MEAEVDLEDAELSSLDVCEIAGVTYRQLDHWCRSGYVPGRRGPVGSGGRRSFTIAQLRRVEQLAEAARCRRGTLVDTVERLARMG